MEEQVGVAAGVLKEPLFQEPPVVVEMARDKATVRFPEGFRFIAARQQFPATPLPGFSEIARGLGVSGLPGSAAAGIQQVPEPGGELGLGRAPKLYQVDSGGVVDQASLKVMTVLQRIAVDAGDRPAAIIIAAVNSFPEI